MKKIDGLFFSITLVFLCTLFSCTVTINGEIKGRLIVSNYSNDNTITITDVYVREKNATGYVLVYSGTIKNSQSYFIELKPGQYSVKVKTLKNSIFFNKSNSFETGYNIYKNLNENKAVKVTFDGKGIFFE